MADTMQLPILPLVSDYLLHAARQRGSQVAMSLGDRRLTFGECDLEVKYLSQALMEMGVKQGDRVAMLCTPRPEFFLTFLAVSSIGAIWVGVNPRNSVEETEFVLGDCAPRVLISIVKFRDRDYTADLVRLTSEHPDLRVVTIGGEVPGSLPFGDLLEMGKSKDLSVPSGSRAQLTGREPALIVYTSGSTGKSKGALLSHYGLIHSYLGQLRHFGSAPMVDVCNLPINHIGCMDLCCMPLLSCGTIHFMEQFDPEGLLRLIEQERVTFLGQVPTMFQLIAESPRFQSANLSSLTTLTWSGSAMPASLIKAYRSRTKARMMVTYGLTEAIAAITYSASDADDDTLSTTIGKPDPLVDVRLVTSDGSLCDNGVEGEIQVRHDAGMLGYYNRPESTVEAFTPDGYLRTGDLAVVRPDGNLVLVGRLKDMFKSGGYNVYPREIELCLENHPCVALAAVVSVKDPVYQEVGHAFVIPKPGQSPTVDELKLWCREHLANYKIPKRIVIAEDLPKLPIGKVDKQALKRLAESS